jgi:hypothetical protein
MAGFHARFVLSRKTWLSFLPSGDQVTPTPVPTCSACHVDDRARPVALMYMPWEKAGLSIC